MLAFASILVSIGSAIFSADAASDAAEANAAEARRVAAANAALDRYNASVVRSTKSSVQREYQSSIMGLQNDTGALLAQNKAVYGNSGVDVSTGSPVSLENRTKELAKRDIDTLLWNQKQKVSELESEAVGYEKAAALGILKGDSQAASIMSNARYNIASIYTGAATSSLSIATNAWGR